MFRKTITHPGFWKSVLVLGLMFAIIYDILDLFFSFGFDFDAYAQAYFSSTESILRFLMANIIGGFIYGFIITYFKFKRKLKEIENKQAS
jgi:hypothetical protein